MDHEAGKRPPKTLADVSHLFFSRTEDGSNPPRPSASDGDTSPQDAGHETATSREAATSHEAATGHETATSREPWERTSVFAVTGGDDSPGKSTVAINLALSLMRFGRVALFDADPSVPNARFYLGLPSSDYLSSLTGGEAAPTVMLRSGLLVADWSLVRVAAVPALGQGDGIHVDVPGSGRNPVDSVVIDVPTSRVDILGRLEGRATTPIVVARPGRDGFLNASAALVALRGCPAMEGLGVVVNRAPDEGYGRRFHAKMSQAAERLLSMESRLLGVVPPHPGLAREQRERGAVVESQSDSAVALSLRGLAPGALELAGMGGARERARA